MRLLLNILGFSFLFCFLGCGGGSGVGVTDGGAQISAWSLSAFAIQATSSGCNITWKVDAPGHGAIVFNEININSGSIIKSFRVDPSTLRFAPTIPSGVPVKFDIFNSNGPKIGSVAPGVYSAVAINPTRRLEMAPSLGFLNTFESISPGVFYRLYQDTNGGHFSFNNNNSVESYDIPNSLPDIYFAYPGVLLDSQQHIHIIYFVSDSPGSFSGQIRHDWFDGTKWTSEVVAQRTLDWTTATHTLYSAIDGFGKIHLMWENYQTTSVNVIECSDNVHGDWSFEVVPKPDSVDSIYARCSRFACDEQGDLFVAIGYGINALLLTKKGDSWAQEVIPTGYIVADGAGPFELVYANGHLGLFYDRPLVNGSGDSIYYLEKQPSAWATPEVVVPYRPFTGFIIIPRVAISKDGSQISFLLNQTSSPTTLPGFTIYSKSTSGWSLSTPMMDVQLGGPGPIMDDIWMNYGDDSRLHLFTRFNGFSLGQSSLDYVVDCIF